MERAVIALLCLSAAFCLASGQSSRCPEDLLLKLQPEAYDERSQALIIRQECVVDLARFLNFPPGIHFIRTYYYTCIEGFIALPAAGVFVCIPVIVDAGSGSPDIDIPVEVEVPEVEVEVEVPEVEVPEPSEQPTRPPQPATGPPSTQRPTTTGGISECPDGAVSNRNRYSYRSLSRIVSRRCYIRTRVHGAPSRHTTTIWECRDGYTRQYANRQYRCVRQ